MYAAVSFEKCIQHVCNVNFSRDSNKILSFFPAFSFLMGTTYDEIDKFITAVHGTNSVRDLDQSIYIPVGVITHLNAPCFE